MCTHHEGLPSRGSSPHLLDLTLAGEEDEDVPLWLAGVNVQRCVNGCLDVLTPREILYRQG